MAIASVILFFAYLWGFGFTLTRLVRESEGFLERNLMRLGFGLSAFVVFGTVLNAMRIPLDYRVFLLASAIVPVYCLVFKKGYSRIPHISMKLTFSNINVLAVLAIFALSLFMYSSGAFRYPYLEDDDPWGHASSAKYVAVEKTAFAPPNYSFHYLDPYPPAYDMIFGIAHQTSSSISWAIKFFNALLISLSLVFFYFFAKEFLGSRNKALFATFVLASVPAYLSHFIWAPVIAMAVFSQTMYAFEMIWKDKRWFVLGGVGVASILLSHPTHAVKLSALILIYIAIKVFSDFVSDKKSWLQQNIAHAKAIVLGFALSLFWWGLNLRTFISVAKGGFTGGSEAAALAIRNSPNIFTKILTLVTKVFHPYSGTASRVYSFQDFVVAQSANMINNPIGFGIAVSVLAFVGVLSVASKFARFLPKPKVILASAVLICLLLTFFVAPRIFETQKSLYENERFIIPQSWQAQPTYSSVFLLTLALFSLITAFVLSLAAIVRGSSGGEHKKALMVSAIILAWLIFAFLGVNNRTFVLPVGLFAFRFWMILAIPAAIIAAEGFFALLNAISAFRLDKATATAAKLIIIIVVVAGILFTSAKQKYDVNTACWPAGAFWSGNYVLEPSSNCPVPGEVLAYNWLRTLPPGTKVFTFSNPDQVIGFDKFSCAWCKPEYDLKKRFYNVTPIELRGFMKDNNYDYFIIGGIDAKTYGFNSTLAVINAAASSGLFTVAYQDQAALIFRAI